MSETSRVPYLICEAANSHGGSEQAILELIARYAAIDYPNKGFKFQVFGAETIALPDFSWYSAYKELEFHKTTWTSLISTAAAHGDVWIDVFDRYALDIVRENIGRIAGLKLQPSILDNQEVLESLRTIDLDGKQLIINVSGFGLDDISRLIESFAEFFANLILQVGFQAYPTDVKDAAFQKIPILRAAFPDLPLAMADHADATSDFAQLAPLYAHLLGCSILEKHFCVDRSTAKYDAYSALEPDEMARLCLRLKDLCMSKSGLFIVGAEKEYLEKSVQIPVLRGDLQEGNMVRLGDLYFRRTAQQGISWQEILRMQRDGYLLDCPQVAGKTLTESDFRPARVAAIVACRMKSSRLQKKAVLPLHGIPSVERCLYQCLAMKGVQQVVLATSTLDEDRILENHRCNGRVGFWRGDPEDVIARYLGACEHFGIDVVVRVTADCPVISTEIAEYLLKQHFLSGADYTAAASAAVGTAAEIMNVSALRKVIALLGRAEYSEYMTWYFRNNPDFFKVDIVELPQEMVRSYRLTLDHQEDFDLFQALYSKVDVANDQTVALSAIFQQLDAHPEIAALNSHIQLKYRTDQELVERLNEKTRIRVSS